MGRLKEIVVDADLPSRLARFWEQALTDYHIRAYDDVEIARLAVLGLTPETDPSVILDGPGPELCFQKMDGPRPARNRIHFDIEAEDRRWEPRPCGKPKALLCSVIPRAISSALSGGARPASARVAAGRG